MVLATSYLYTIAQEWTQAILPLASTTWLIGHEINHTVRKTVFLMTRFY